MGGAKGRAGRRGCGEGAGGVFTHTHTRTHARSPAFYRDEEYRRPAAGGYRDLEDFLQRGSVTTSSVSLSLCLSVSLSLCLSLS